MTHKDAQDIIHALNIIMFGVFYSCIFITLKAVLKR